MIWLFKIYDWRRINFNTKIKPSFVISVRDDFREKSRLRDRAEYKNGKIQRRKENFQKDKRKDMLGCEK